MAEIGPVQAEYKQRIKKNNDPLLKQHAERIVGVCGHTGC